ncbi:unnamed protein product, partial [Strongylus vulgaris]
VPYIAPQQAYTQPAVVGGSHPYSLKAPYAAAAPPVQQVAAVPQVVPQQATYMTTQPTMYATQTAVPQQMVGIPQQPAPVAVPYATTIQQQTPAIGVQSSAPMTTQQYFNDANMVFRQTVGLQQTQHQQQGTTLGMSQPQQTTLNAPYAGMSTATQWMQQQPAQQQVMGVQRSQSVVPQQPYQSSGLVKLNLV